MHLLHTYNGTNNTFTVYLYCEIKISTSSVEFAHLEYWLTYWRTTNWLTLHHHHHHHNFDYPTTYASLGTKICGDAAPTKSAAVAAGKAVDNGKPHGPTQDQDGCITPAPHQDTTVDLAPEDPFNILFKCPECRWV